MSILPPFQIKNLKAHIEIQSQDLDRLSKERDRLQKIQAEMAADLERLLSNRQEMALVKRFLKSALNDSKGVAATKQSPMVEIKGAGNGLGDDSVPPDGVGVAAAARSGKGDGPKSLTDCKKGFLNDIFPEATDDEPKPTIFTRPKTLVMEPL